jgi:hypothetical protein
MKLLTAWVPVEQPLPGGSELIWGEGIERVLKRAGHAFPMVLTTTGAGVLGTDMRCPRYRA